MRDSDRLRDRAARLRVLADQANEEGKTLLSFELTRLANEASEQADEMDERNIPTPHQPPEQPAQQQQQPQPEDEKK